MSLAKNLTKLKSVAPRYVVTWDKAERIIRNKEIWDDKDSVVHRLPEHYKHRYWRDLLRDAAPVHYRPPTERFSWDEKRLVQVEHEHYPIIPIYPLEADQGLWGGEGILKGYHESRPMLHKKILPRNWPAKMWWAGLKSAILYSEVLDKHMKITVTERTLRLIDSHFGLDSYLLETPEIDLRSKLGCKLKREILISLAKRSYYPNDPERRSFIKEKYAEHVLPLEEAEWVGLDLNEACVKLQNIEDERPKVPLKFKLENDLLKSVESGQVDLDSEDD